jgi:ribosomal protein S8E
MLTIINFTQVNVSELGLVTPAGKVVWGKASVQKKFSCFLLFLKS